VRQLAQELIELLLPICQLATATVVDTEAGHDAVDYEESELIGREA